jgi:predicted amino acid racemase
MDLMSKTIRKNRRLVEVATELHQSGQIPPDTYVLDLDMIRSNSEKLQAEANRVRLKSYICSKEFGRNPLVIKTIMNTGMNEALGYDIEEIKVLHRYGIPIGHVGHFGQIPNFDLPWVMQQVKPEFMTVYSIEKAWAISKIAGKAGFVQKVLVKVIEDERLERLATASGFVEDDSISFAKLLQQLDNLKVAGVTSYPATDFSLISKTHSLSASFIAMMRVVRRMEEELGIEVEQVNACGRNCVANMELTASNGATVIEPGHSFIGTLPNHLFEDDSPELPAVIYVTEISHMFSNYAIAFGDSFNATAVIGSLKNDIKYEYLYAFIGDTPEELVKNGPALALPQNLWQSDLGWSMYANILPTKEHRAKVGDTVVFGYRPQIYRVPRGRTAVVSGIQKGTPKLLGIFDRAGIMFQQGTENPVGYDRTAVLKIMDSLPQN